MIRKPHNYSMRDRPEEARRSGKNGAAVTANRLVRTDAGVLSIHQIAQRLGVTPSDASRRVSRRRRRNGLYIIADLAKD